MTQTNSLKFVVYGAGGVGGVIGGKLFQAGWPVTLIARGEHARSIRTSGLRLVCPGADQVLPLTVVEHPTSLEFDAHTVVLMCMKSQHMRRALEDLSLCRGADRAVLVCVQNGVANESLALRYFAQVYGCVVNLPAMFIHPGEVASYGQGVAGILDVGAAPQGNDACAQQVAAAFTAAGFSARPQPAIMRWKYAKLLLNLLNVLQACLADYAASTSLRKRIREEALACFDAAGIDCASKAEVTNRASGPDGTALMRMVDLPGYERTAGSSWQSLARGTGDIETEYLNGEICYLGRLHGVPTPVNQACVLMARQTIAQQLGPGSFTTAQLIAMAEHV